MDVSSFCRRELMNYYDTLIFVFFYQDEEFLEQEAQFLNRLQKSRDTSKLKSSLPLNSTVY